MGGGGIFSSIFGGGYDAPDPVQYEPTPTREDAEAEESGTRDAERKRNRARAGGVRSTILSNPLGGSSSGGGSGSLGSTSSPG